MSFHFWPFARLNDRIDRFVKQLSVHSTSDDCNSGIPIFNSSLFWRSANRFISFRRLRKNSWTRKIKANENNLTMKATMMKRQLNSESISKRKNNRTENNDDFDDDVLCFNSAHSKLQLSLFNRGANNWWNKIRLFLYQENLWLC